MEPRKSRGRRSVAWVWECVGLLLVVLLATAGECPIAKDDDTDATTEPQHFDVGGPQGTTWRILTLGPITVTLHADGKTVTAQVDEGRSALDMLGRTLAVGDLCWRTDVLCPQHVLPDQMLVLQPASHPGSFLAQPNRRGPLAHLPPSAGLVGSISGNDLAISLSEQSSGEDCRLQPGSTVLATAFVEDEISSDVTSSADASDGSVTDGWAANGSPNRVATRIDGRIAVAYTGLCVTMGGTGILEQEDVLELSVAFTAHRE